MYPVLHTVCKLAHLPMWLACTDTAHILPRSRSVRFKSPTIKTPCSPRRNHESVSGHVSRYAQDVSPELRDRVERFLDFRGYILFHERLTHEDPFVERSRGQKNVVFGGQGFPFCFWSRSAHVLAVFVPACAVTVTQPPNQGFVVS